MPNFENPSEVEFYYRSNSWDELLVADVCRGYEMKFSEGDKVCSMNFERTSAPEELTDPVTLNYYSLDTDFRAVIDCDNSEVLMDEAVELIMLSPPERVKWLCEHAKRRDLN
ncbi:MAG: hypothetical protein AAGA18_06115 [Verrucomicrobiota bacterium]